MIGSIRAAASLTALIAAAAGGFTLLQAGLTAIRGKALKRYYGRKDPKVAGPGKPLATLFNAERIIAMSRFYPNEAKVLYLVGLGLEAVAIGALVVWAIT